MIGVRRIPSRRTHHACSCISSAPRVVGASAYTNKWGKPGCSGLYSEIPSEDKSNDPFGYKPFVRTACAIYGVPYEDNPPSKRRFTLQQLCAVVTVVRRTNSLYHHHLCHDGVIITWLL